MSGLKTSLAVFALLGGFAASAQAQGMVPGGWSAQFGYQPLGASGFIGGAAYGTGVPGLGSTFGYGGFSAYGMGASPYGYGQSASPYGLGIPQTSNPLNFTAATPQTAVGTDPLIRAIRQSTRRSRRR